jgi:hypothetical protein
VTQPNPGKLMFKVFRGEPEAVVDEVNAFLDEHDLQKFPVTNAQTQWNSEATKLAVLLTIVAAPGSGRPPAIVPARIVPRTNGEAPT